MVANEACPIKKEKMKRIKERKVRVLEEKQQERRNFRNKIVAIKIGGVVCKVAVKQAPKLLGIGF